MTSFAFKSSPLALLETAIESNRLSLVPTTEAHAEAIFSSFTAEITTYMMPKPAEAISETLTFIRASRAAAAAGHNLQLTITAKATGEFLGCCGLHGNQSVRTPELGIWLKRQAHAQGYGREAVFALVAWARTQFELEGFVYPVDRRNHASRNIPRALGGRVIQKSRDVGLGGNTLELFTYYIDAASLEKYL